MKKLICILILNCLICGAGFAQWSQAKIDSLENVLQTAGKDTNRLFVLNKLVHLYLVSDLIKSKERNLQLLKLSRNLINADGEIRYWNNYAEFCLRDDKYDSAIFYNQKALSMAVTYGNKQLACSSLWEIVKDYEYAQKDSIAFIYAEELLKVAQSIPDSSDIYAAYENLGRLCAIKKDFKKARGYFLEALNYSGPADSSNTDRTDILFSLGRTQHELSNTKSAEIYLQQALARYEYAGNNHYLSLCMMELAIVYTEENKTDASLQLCKRKNELDESEGYAQGVMECYLLYGNNYRALKLFDLALEYHNKANRLALEFHGLYEIPRTYDALVEDYKQMGDKAKEKMYLQKAKKAREKQ